MDDSTLIRKFASCDLPYEAWCHRLHVRLAFLFLQTHPFEEALRRFRAGLRAYNVAHHVPDGLTTGYHETLTVAWLRLIASRMPGMSGAFDSDAFCEANPDLLDKSTLRRFYSRERIVSWKAKYYFVRPDLDELPVHGCCPTSGCS
jgi:hypothetical protein